MRACFNSLSASGPKTHEKALIGSALGLPLNQSAVGRGQGHMIDWKLGSRKRGMGAATRR